MHQPHSQQRIIDRLHQRGFNAIYQRSLLYNTCWEDPALDRAAMKLQADDRVVMITSAGCNALDYAIDGPQSIQCVDANPRQNALLDLKIAGIKTLSYHDFFAIFGHGHHAQMRELYIDALRPHLSTESRQFWDQRLHWWNGRGWRNSFYFYGLSGMVARCFQTIINRRPKLSRAVQDLLVANDLEQQRKNILRRGGAKIVWPLDPLVIRATINHEYARRAKGAGTGGKSESSPWNIWIY